LAVDPATVKLAIKAATTILTDEKARQKVIIIAIAPLAAFILIVCLFFHILTMPLQWLSNFFFGNDYDTVRAVRVEHGYDQYVDPNSEDYLNGVGLDYSGVSFTDGATTVHYYNQLDDRWKDEPYGKQGTIGSSGCGPTSLAMAVSSLTTQTIDPVQMCTSWSFAAIYRA